MPSFKLSFEWIVFNEQIVSKLNNGNRYSFFFNILIEPNAFVNFRGYTNRWREFRMPGIA